MTTNYSRKLFNNMYMTAIGDELDKLREIDYLYLLFDVMEQEHNLTRMHECFVKIHSEYIKLCNIKRTKSIECIEFLINDMYSKIIKEESK